MRTCSVCVGQGSLQGACLSLGAPSAQDQAVDRKRVVGYLGLSACSSSAGVQREVVSFSVLFSKVHKYLKERKEQE